MTPEQDNKATVSGCTRRSARAISPPSLACWPVTSSTTTRRRPMASKPRTHCSPRSVPVARTSTGWSLRATSSRSTRTTKHRPRPPRMAFFKLRNGKIVEHWDVIQDLPEHTASGQDMFSELS